jgi:hypothetical protein
MSATKPANPSDELCGRIRRALWRAQHFISHRTFLIFIDLNRGDRLDRRMPIVKKKSFPRLFDSMAVMTGSLQ